MKNTLCFIFLGAVWSTRALHGEEAWTYVPASAGSRPLEAYVIAEHPTEKVVSLVGAGPLVTRRILEPRRVFAIELPVPADGIAPQTLARPVAAVPLGAHWPDADGRIAAVPSLGANTAKGLRNPWEVRIHRGSAGVDSVFLCGGVVTGGEAGPVALLNGRVVRQGDATGRFLVSSVIAAGVVLERNGSYFVIPLGTRTTITAVDG
jgi:hypothetical protein